MTVIMEKISPRVDLAFKKIFGVEENKDLLISLINSIVSQDDQVSDITLLNPYNPKNFRQDKLSILDRLKALPYILVHELKNTLFFDLAFLLLFFVR